MRNLTLSTKIVKRIPSARGLTDLIELDDRLSANIHSITFSIALGFQL